MRNGRGPVSGNLPATDRNDLVEGGFHAELQSAMDDRNAGHVPGGGNLHMPLEDNGN